MEGWLVAQVEIEEQILVRRKQPAAPLLSARTAAFKALASSEECKSKLAKLQASQDKTNVLLSEMMKLIRRNASSVSTGKKAQPTIEVKAALAPKPAATKPTVVSAVKLTGDK